MKKAKQSAGRKSGAFSAIQPSPPPRFKSASKPFCGGRAAPVSLQKQEQIRGPKNGSIARFDGLGCYQSESEKSGLSGMSGSRNWLSNGLWAGFGRALGGHFGVYPQSAPEHEKRKPDAASARRFSLFFQEQIQGLQNGSIARFDGLGCYQSRSETGDVFGGGLAEPVLQHLQAPGFTPDCAPFA